MGLTISTSRYAVASPVQIEKSLKNCAGSSTSIAYGHSDLPSNDQYKRWNILVEIVPEKIVQLIVSYLQIRVFTFNKNKDYLHDKIVTFPNNFWIERESSCKDQPSLVMTIGAPGSGKTTWATSRYQNVYAADDFFEEKNLDFSCSLLSRAHSWCRAKVFRILRKGDSVCVANTNTMLSAMFPYVAAVVFGELPHKIVFVRMPFSDSQLLLKRTLHGVPEKIIWKMLADIKSMGRPTISSVLKGGPFPERKPKCSSVVSFLAIILYEDSVKMLREVVRKNSKWGLLEDQKNCHVMMKLNPTDEEVERAKLGEDIEVQVKKIFINEWCQCASVSFNEKYYVMKSSKNCHITVACQAGIGSVTSKYVIEHSRIWKESNIILKGRIGASLTKSAMNSPKMSVAAKKSLSEVSEENKCSEIIWSYGAVDEISKQIENNTSKKTQDAVRLAEDSPAAVFAKKTHASNISRGRS